MASKKDLDQLCRSVGGTALSRKLPRSRVDEITCTAPGGMTWDGENDAIVANTVNDAFSRVDEAIRNGGPHEMQKA